MLLMMITIVIIKIITMTILIINMRISDRNGIRTHNHIVGELSTI